MTQTIDTNLVRKQLKTVAQQRSLIDYKTLANHLNLKPPATIAQLTALLESCQEDDAVLDQPQLTAVVIQKSGPRCPRPGFFMTLKTLGLYFGPEKGPEAEMWHQNELERTYEFYRN